MATFSNPVLPGSHPDPSICRVGEDYYLATSTFEYFPGIALHHSRDLVNWRPIGSVLDRPEQLDLDGIASSKGIYAPTLRQHDGTFYVVCTVVADGPQGGNFVVTATHPAGPWSEPSWLRGADGFDPSLLFAGDGRAWYCGTEERDPVRAPGITTVWLRQFDPQTLTLVGDVHDLWSGAIVGARWAEGPHIYEIDGSFYLLAAEGGTEHKHAVVVARADLVTGPYVGCESNPVLTHRHLGKDMSIVGTGHADLVQTPAGDWWAVLLAMRPYDGYCWNLGRETFLVPVTWEDGWPVFNYGVGRVLLDERLPALPVDPLAAGPIREDFDGDTLGPTWLFLRTPRSQWWSLRERPGHLRLQLRPQSLWGNENPSFVGRRQQHRNFLAATSVEVVGLADGETAGLVLRHSDEHSVRLELALVDGSRVVRVVRRIFGVEDEVGHTGVLDGPVELAIEARGMSHEFRVRSQGGDWRSVAQLDARFLSFTEAEGFFGVVIAMFASSNGSPAASDGKPSVSDFDWFDYSGS